MDDESTQQEQSLNEDAPTLDANRTIEDENLIVGNELPDKENVSSQAQTHGSPVEAQYAVGGTSSPTRQRYCDSYYIDMLSFY